MQAITELGIPDETQRQDYRHIHTHTYIHTYIHIHTYKHIRQIERQKH